MSPANANFLCALALLIHFWCLYYCSILTFSNLTEVIHIRQLISTFQSNSWFSPTYFSLHLLRLPWEDTEGQGNRKDVGRESTSQKRDWLHITERGNEKRNV